MPSLIVNINYGTQNFPAGSTFTRSVIEARKASDGTLVQSQPNVPANAASWTFNGMPADLYNVTCQAMSGDSPLGAPVAKQYTVQPDVALSVPISLA